jgi:hypothetical protein
MNQDITEAEGSLRSTVRSMVLLCAALALVGLSLAGCTECTHHDPNTCETVYSYWP